jgi:hypothetical protein
MFMSFWTIASVAGVLWVMLRAAGIELGLRMLGARRG